MKKKNTKFIFLRIILLVTIIYYLLYILTMGAVFHNAFYLPSFFARSNVKRLLKEENPNKKYKIRYLETKFYDTGKCVIMSSLGFGCLRTRYNLSRFSYYYTATDSDDRVVYTVRYDTGGSDKLKIIKVKKKKVEIPISEEEKFYNDILTGYKYNIEKEVKYEYDGKHYSHLPIIVYNTGGAAIDNLINRFETKLKNKKYIDNDDQTSRSIDLYFINKSREKDVELIEKCVYKYAYSDDKNNCDELNNYYYTDSELIPIFRYVIKKDLNNKKVLVESEEYKISYDLMK